MIIDGKQISQSLKDAMKIEVEALAEQYGRRPCLMVIIVGDNPASRSYVRGKIKATEYCGFDGHLVELPEDCSEDTSRRDRQTQQRSTRGRYPCAIAIAKTYL